MFRAKTAATPALVNEPAAWRIGVILAERGEGTTGDEPCRAQKGSAFFFA